MKWNIIVSNTAPKTTSGTGVLWQDLADALNALVDAGQFPNFHDRYGSRNEWRHQPYANASSPADAPWVVFDLAARQFTVSSRARVLSGEHSRRPRTKRR